MENINNVCVFCASSPNTAQVYLDQAFELGRLLALNGMSLVTGGGSMGLMASVEDGALSVDGKVTAVIPQFMIEAGWLHKGIKDVVITETMHERKQRMFGLSDAIVTLPGGCGTLDELTEALTLKQLGLLSCPVVIMNSNGYFEYLLRHLQRQSDEGFMRPVHLELWSVASDPAAVLDQLRVMPEWDTRLGKLTPNR